MTSMNEISVDKYNSLVTQYCQQADYIEVYIKTKQIEIESLQQDINTLKEQYTAAQGYSDTLKQDNHAKQGVIDTLKQDNHAKQRFIDTLQQDNHAKQGIIDTLKKEKLNSFKQRKPTSPRYIKMII